MTLDDTVAAALRLGLAAIIAPSLWRKLRRPDELAAAIAGYQRALPLADQLPPAAAAAPVLLAEAAAIAGLVALNLPAAAYPAAGLFLFYAAAMAAVVARGRRDVDCGCSWGPARQPVSAGLVVRNLVLALLAALAAGAAAPLDALRPIDWGSILLAAGVVLALYAASTTLIANAAHLKETRP